MPARQLLKRSATQLALLAACTAPWAQEQASAAEEDRDAVTITAYRNPVDKSYRKMVRGMELFERQHHLAPDASLRFKLLPRRPNSSLDGIELEIAGDSVSVPVTVAADHTFTLERHRLALKEDASVRSNRKAMSMTWRAEIRSPGVPADTRRLGDLRLECAVGMEAGLISNERTSWLAEFLFAPKDYCNTPRNRYLFFADCPLFNVVLVAGTRREALPVDRLYGGASVDPDWKEDLPYCDCEVLMDRAYFLPLGDPSWPDDTLVEFEYMDDGNERAAPQRAVSR